MNSILKGFRYSLAALAFVFAGSAQALMLTPGDADFTDDTTSNLNGDDVASIVGATSTLTLFYKADFGGGEDGTFEDSYDTTFSAFDGDGEPHNALIEYTGGDFIVCPACYLVVKDGQVADPAQFLFDLADWDGMEDLVLTDFFLDGGAISNVAIWGNSEPRVQVPEPSALILIGLGLIGLGMARRRVAF